MDAAMRALAHDARRRIVALTWDADRTAGGLADEFAMSRPGVSQHLRVLREAGLLTVRDEGTRRYYRANREEVRKVQALLEAFWDARLRRLKFIVEADARKRRR